MSLRTRIDDLLDDTRVAFSGPLGARRARRWSRGLPAGLLLVAVCLATYLPGLFTLPTVDRDEARFAQASRQMLESITLNETSRNPAMHDGGLIIPKVMESPRLNKPPLIYWLQTASAAVFTGGDAGRDAIWMYRIPSVLCSIIAVLATWRAGLLLFDPRVAATGAACLAVCPMVVWDAHQARADQLLLACTASAFWCLAGVYRAAPPPRDVVRNWITPIGFWAALGLGVLAKGPIAPMIAVLTAIAIVLTTRRSAWLARLRPLTGTAVLAVIVLPWFIAVAQRVGFSEYAELVIAETLGRAGSPTEGHGGPPGYHTVLLAVLFWPGSMLTAVAIAAAFSRARGHSTRTAPRPNEDDASGDPPTPPPLWRRAASAVFGRYRGHPPEILCLAWVVPAWLVFELSATKLPHYTLPLYPPIALLSARAVLAAAAGSLPEIASTPTRWGLGIWIGIGATIGIAVPLGVCLLGTHPAAVAATLAVTALTALLLVKTRGSVRLGRTTTALTFGIAAAISTAVALIGIALPNASTPWVTRRVIEAIEAARADGADRPAATLGYHEDSLIFESRGTITRADDPVVWARANPRGVLVLPAQETPALEAEPGFPPFERRETIPGWNYSRGEPVRLDVLLLSPPPRP